MVSVRLYGHLLLAVLLGGCATARPSTTISVAELGTVEVEASCRQIAADAAGSPALASALKYGTLASAYFVLRGAADGAWWGAVTGGDAGKGAWIGAAVGAGLGTMVGVVAGVKNGVERHGRYRGAYDRCVEDGREAERAKDRIL
jgi:hypothetical protein